MTIGLFGGSFNPPHDGHRLVTLTALRRLGLDRVWWLVTPGNPLKDTRGLPPLAERMAAARHLMRHPRVAISGIEAAIGTRYTLETIRWLTRRCPGVRFVWIMGADNLSGFHRWQGWREIAALVPIAVIDRPGNTVRSHQSRAATVLERWRLDETDGRVLAHLRPPAWIFLHGPRSVLSSTALRAGRQHSRVVAGSID
jgi:nicotinate-nucleotide adenylyltransferase